MKKIYILPGILFNICILSRSFSQVVDTIPPLIVFSSTDIEDSLPSDCSVFQEGDTISIGLSCVYHFPTDYINIASPIITDETDPAPKVETITTIDSLKREVVRYWIGTDSAGNVSNYKEIVFYNEVEHQLNLNTIEINGGITIVNTDLFEDSDFFKRDSIFFCNNSVLNFTIDSDWDCDKYKKEFNWYVNGEPAYSKDRYLYSLSLDTLPAAVDVIVEANEINNNFENRINFTIQHLPKAQTEIVNPSCNGSKDGSILVLGASSVKWDDNSVNLFRQGLASGKYWFSYGNDSCQYTDTIVLVPDKELEFSISSNAIDLSQQNYITISNTSTLEGPYVWQIGDTSFINNNKEFKFFLSEAGNYSIDLWVGGGNCTDKINKTFTVSGELPSISFEVINPTCKGSADGSIFISGTTSVLWENESDSPLRQNLDFGKYWVSYSNSTGSHTDTIVLVQENHLNFSLSDDQIDLGQKNQIDITNTSTLIGLYQWDIGDSSFINNNQEFEFNVTKPGNLVISLSLAASSCTDTLTKTVTVTGQIPTGFQTENLDKIEISSVLANDLLQLYIPGDGIYAARIIDLQGIEMVYVTRINSGKSNIPVENLSAGTYIIQVFKEAKMVFNQKFIKPN